MTLSVKFFQPFDGGGGQLDPMRVLSGASAQGDNLSAAVLFSALSTVPAYVENFAWQDGSRPQQGLNLDWSFTTGRVYKTFPLALITYANTTADRMVFYPGFNNGGYWLTAQSSRNGNGTYTISGRVFVNTNSVPNSPKPNGILRCYVTGQVA